MSIAIIGMACRFPGAPDATTLWSNVLGRRSSLRPIAHGRWNQTRLEEASPRDPLHVTCRTQAYLDDLELFARKYFGIPPRRAEVMDPQQRLSLEVAREALQDAGLERSSWDRQRSACFMGASVSEYNQLCVSSVRLQQAADGLFGQSCSSEQARQLADRSLPVRTYTLSGNQLSMCAGVVAQFYDLGGPALAVDAACASSLAAVVQAVHYLRGLRASSGPSPVALAGGVYLSLLPDNLLAFSRVGLLARAECRPFDAAADGFILGEGAGMVVLKRLEDARRDHDRIYAVIEGVAWGSDGRGAGPVTPAVDGQRRCLSQALAEAGWDRVGYCECHGTGTAQGDPAELEALASVLAAPAWLGSIKSNIGHALSAAGVAGLMRAALATWHGLLPPQTAWERWHPRLEGYADRFTLSPTGRPWEGERRATVSAFGFGGVNAVVALRSEEQPQPPADRELVFCCSAPTAALLRSYLGELEERLEETPLAALAYTQTVRREIFSWVCVFVAADVAGARACLRAAAEELARPPSRLSLLEPGLVLGPLPERRGVVFLVPGHCGRLAGPELARHLEAQLAWLCERGLAADVKLGHSLGDLVARGQPLSFWEALEATPSGGLVSVRMSREESLPLASELGWHWAGRLHSRLQLLGGAGLATVETELERRGLLFRVIDRRYAFHTPLVGDGPADFLPALQEALATRPALWLEVGPGESLCQAVRAEAPGELALSEDQFLLALGVASALGRPIRHELLFPEPRLTSLPVVPLERHRFWAIRPGQAARVELPAEVSQPERPEQAVLALLAQVGGLPPEQISRRHRLTGHLGFDSLMLFELHGQLQARLGRAPEPSFWETRPTVGELIDHLRQLEPDPYPEVRAVLGRVEEFRARGWEMPYLHTHEPRGGALTEVGGRVLVSFSSYDYLGLASHPRVKAAAAEALERWGTSVSASRLVSGQRSVHDRLEETLAEFLGVESAIALVSGHATNVSLLPCLVGPGDLVAHDSLIHDSVLQGIRLSGAARAAFAHNDLAALDGLLRSRAGQHRRVLVAVEGVYGMDGDLCDLPGLVSLRQRHGFLLMVDEAHSLGVLGARGRGVAEHFGVDRAGVDFWMGTLSKALGSCGGYVAASRFWVDYLKLSAPGFVYSVGMPPASAAAALAALSLVDEERVGDLRRKATLFRRLVQGRGCDVGTSSEGVPIVPVRCASVDEAVLWTAELHQRGVHVLPILYPASTPRLRFFVTASHRQEQLEQAAELLG